MKKLLKLLLLPALCAFFLLQAQQVAAQSKDNDVLVMEFGRSNPLNVKTAGIFIFWPDKEIEKIDLLEAGKTELGGEKILYKKINELADLGWELIFINSNGTGGNVSYYFKRAVQK
jgi:hypothetical protein